MAAGAAAVCWCLCVCRLEVAAALHSVGLPQLVGAVCVLDEGRVGAALIDVWHQSSALRFSLFFTAGSFERKHLSL